MKTKRYVLVLMTHYFSSGLMTSIMSLVLLDKGLTIGTLGLGLAAYSVTVVLLEVPSGIMADMLGKKRVFLLSLYISSAAFLLVLPGFGPLYTVGGLILYGVGRAFASGTVEALFISRYMKAPGPDRLSGGMRVLSLCESMGLAFGALLGGVLPSLSSGVMVLLGPYDLTLLLRASLSFLVAMLAAFLIPDDRLEKKEKQVSLKMQLASGIKLILLSRNLKSLLPAAIGLGLLLALMEVYWQPYLLNLLGGGSGRTAVLGVVSMTYFAAISGGSILSEKLLSKRRCGEKGMFLSARIIMLLLLAAAALMKVPILFIVFYCLFYFSLGAANVAEGSVFHQAVPDSHRASFLSVQSLMMQSGFLLSSGFSGTVVERVSIPGLWLIGACIAFLFMIPAFWLQKTAHTPLEQERQM